MTPRSALADCIELSGLDARALDHLADAATLDPLVPGTPLRLDGGLGWVVRGAVQVRRRGPKRRAPVVSALGRGGLVGLDPEGLLTEVVGLQHGAWARVSAEALRGLRQPVPGLAPRLDERSRVLGLLPWLVSRMRRSPTLAHAPPSSLHRLLRGARVRQVEPVTAHCAAGTPLRAVWVVLAGEVLLRTDKGTVRVLGPGDVWGDLALVAERAWPFDAVTGPVPATLLELPIDWWLRCLGESTRLRRATLAGSYGSAEQRVRLVKRAGRHTPITPGLTTLGGIAPGPASTLVRWVAEGCTETWSDRTVLLVLDPSADQPIVSREDLGRRTLITVRLPPHAPLAAWPSLPERTAQADTLLLDPGSAPLPEHWAAAVDRTLCVGPVDPRGAGVPMPLWLVGDRPRGAAPPSGAVRLPTALLEAAGRGGDRSGLPPALAEAVGRLTRAATDRRIGLALGGGGALSMAHVPLIRGLLAAGVPLDLVSGTSGGAVVAAFYAAEGLPGLDHLIHLWAEVGRVGLKCWASSAPMAELIDGALGGVRLEDLALPFLPVAVDIDRVTQETLDQGTVGTGVRASGSFPGPFAPTVLQVPDADGQLRHRRYVDGGILNLVPVDTLFAEGAALAISSNAVGPPQPRDALKAGRTTGRLQRARQTVAPARRVEDGLRSAYLMMSHPAEEAPSLAAAHFLAPDLGFSPLDWGRGGELLRALETDPVSAARLQATIDRAVASLRSLHWRRGRPVPGGPTGLSVAAEVTRDGG